MVRPTDRPAMIIAVDLGRKATKHKHTKPFGFQLLKSFICFYGDISKVLRLILHV